MHHPSDDSTPTIAWMAVPDLVEMVYTLRASPLFIRSRVCMRAVISCFDEILGRSVSGEFAIFFPVSVHHYVSAEQREVQAANKPS